MTRFTAFLVLSVLVAVVAAQGDVHLAKDSKSLRKQLFIYQILWKPKDLEQSFPDVVRKAANFEVEDLLTANVDQDASQDFIEQYNKGILPRNRSVTAFYPSYLDEIKAFFNVLYSAEDFETFAVIATWSRDVLNLIIWFFCVIIAFFTRQDTHDIHIPNVHESLSQYFYNLDVLTQFNQTQDSGQGDTHLVKDREFLRTQLFMYQVLWKSEDLQQSFPDVASKAANFEVQDLLTANVDQDAAQAYIEQYNKGILPRDRSATAFYPPHMAEIKAFFKVLYTAADFETFAVILTWSRNVLNQTIWYFCVIIASLTRHDTRRIRIPNVHESLPQYFYNLDVLTKFNKTQNSGQCSISENRIIARYSKIVSQLDDSDPEALIAYYTEDIGVNNFYFYQALDVPFFMSRSEYDIDTYRRGERYFNDHKMFLARYNLERLSHNLGVIEDLDWDQNILTGYYPYMADYNGIPFPQRPRNSPVPCSKQQFLTLIKKYQKRLIQAANTGNLQGSDAPQGDEFLDNLMNAAQGNADSPDQDYYGSYDVTARHILGFNPEPTDPFNYIISALENLNADVRDPAFYRMSKSILSIGIRYKARLPIYTTKDIGFPGVKIESVNVPSIKTFFSKFDAILGYQQCKYKKSPVLVKQKRLNHRKFNIGVKINSEVSTKAVVRIFIGPKFDEREIELTLQQSQHSYFQLDQFLVNLTKGVNNIERRDSEFAFQQPDDLRTDEFYNLIKASVANKNAGLLVRQRPYGWPCRLIIPRGKPDGLTLRLFIIVNEFDEDKAVRTDSLIAGKGLFDGRSMGFPFDRPVNDVFESTNFKSTNFAFEDVVVYHNQWSIFE